MADSRPSAMTLGLVRVTVRVGIGLKVDVLAACRGVPSYLEVSRSPSYAGMSTLHGGRIRGQPTDEEDTSSGRRLKDIGETDGLIGELVQTA